MSVCVFVLNMSDIVKNMPVYVIIEKREFEQLFETTDTDGKEVTGLNVKAKDQTKKNTRVHLPESHRSKKRKRSKDRAAPEPEQKSSPDKQSCSQPNSASICESGTATESRESPSKSCASGELSAEYSTDSEFYSE